jgi:Family of unknown function (DUF6328)
VPGTVSRQERDLDQEWGELIEENRLAMPGTQVLFAFLLILPFQQRFKDLDDGQIAVYYAALLCAAAATVLLIAPTAAHRIRWRQGDKEALLRLSTRTGIAATVFLALGMTASVYLITDFLFGEPWTVIAATILGGAFAWFWFGLPLVRRMRDHR